MGHLQTELSFYNSYTHKLVLAEKRAKSIFHECKWSLLFTFSVKWVSLHAPETRRKTDRSVKKFGSDSAPWLLNYQAAILWSVLSAVQISALHRLYFFLSATVNFTWICNFLEIRSLILVASLFLIVYNVWSIIDWHCTPRSSNTSWG